ncbi:type II toxin-antitoxin system RelE/ParE family toxin [uncultured Chryseobacterium sp.]|uniref:type II toxin-antitoxin system RelE/ParE family toxin n=1 Tax=uncultured Chryseobacterium sp. TaxID=259322 RepID=UPI0025F41A4D|nr:type II toxin-antitoxin system RelE/ParE family toxin [uncultured Chryseobacterium sp.]
MEAELIYSHFVKDDLKEIHDWYKKIDKKLWNQFKKEFQSKINFIKENPLTFEIKYDRQRILFLKKIPYGIHFIYDEKQNRIEIYSVFHTSRNPEQWSNRK